METHLTALRGVYSGSELTSLPDGTSLMKVPSVVLPDGWNQKTTTIWFLVPVGFPLSRPDCFWADADLRLASGAMPMNANLTALPLRGENRTWFSWHLQQWNPVTDGLLSYVRVIQDRLRRAN
jgi:hypothetical protein